MTLQMTRYGFGSLALIGALTLAACSGSPAASMSPTGPSSAVGSTASFNPNPSGEPPPPPPCETSTSVNNDTEPCEPPPPPPPPTGDQGCTPGYWKANVKKGAGEWAVPTTRLVGVVFTAATAPYASHTLLQALEYGGGPGVSGATQNLLRAAVAAYLNARSNGVLYPRDADDIVSDVNAAIASGNRNTMLALAGELDADNNLGCPLNNSGN